jgi:hypothetical protein
LYNLSKDQFGTSYGDTVVNFINWIFKCDRSKLVCANELYYLCHPTSAVTWRAEHLQTYLDAVVRFWKDWQRMRLRLMQGLANAVICAVDKRQQSLTAKPTNFGVCWTYHAGRCASATAPVSRLAVLRPWPGCFRGCAGGAAARWGGQPPSRHAATISPTYIARMISLVVLAPDRSGATRPGRASRYGSARETCCRAGVAAA